MTPNAVLVLSWIGRFIVLFSLFASITSKGKLPVPLKLMRLHLIFAFLLQASITTCYFLKISRGLFFHIYIVEEFILDMLFYQSLLKKTHPFKDKTTKRSIFLIAIVAFVAFAIVNVLFIGNIDTFPKYVFMVQCVLMIICTNWYSHTRSFTEPNPVVYTELSSFKLYKGPVFWMNAGKLLYFASSLFVFLPYNVIFSVTKQETVSMTWIVQYILVIVLHIFMGIGFLKYKSSPKDVADMEQKLNKQL